MFVIFTLLKKTPADTCLNVEDLNGSLILRTRYRKRFWMLKEFDIIDCLEKWGWIFGNSNSSEEEDCYLDTYDWSKQIPEIMENWLRFQLQHLTNLRTFMYRKPSATRCLSRCIRSQDYKMHNWFYLVFVCRSRSRTIHENANLSEVFTKICSRQRFWGSWRHSRWELYVSSYCWSVAYQRMSGTYERITETNGSRVSKLGFLLFVCCFTTHWTIFLPFRDAISCKCSARKFELCMASRP